MCPDDQGADGVSMEDLAARLVHPVHWTFATHHRINLQGGGLLKERKCRSGAHNTLVQLNSVTGKQTTRGQALGTWQFNWWFVR